MSNIEMDRLVKVVHEALGGNGWAYANFGNDELVTQRDSVKQIDTIIDDGTPTDYVMWREALRTAIAAAEGTQP